QVMEWALYKLKGKFEQYWPIYQNGRRFDADDNILGHGMQEEDYILINTAIRVIKRLFLHPLSNVHILMTLGHEPFPLS
ncbi:hypothetical protein PMAYCL1PPCAC_05402, partial [Pristionchus mayeri]